MLYKIIKYSIDLKIQANYFAHSLWVSLVVSPIAWLLTYILGYANKVLLRDHDFIAGIVTVVIIDGIMGAWKWIKLSKFNEKKLAIGIIEKLAICIFAMVIFNTLILAAGDHPDIVSYMNLLAALTILIYPALSAFKNMFFITNGKFPPIGWMRKMESFNDTANIDEIFKQEKAKQDETV